MAEAPVPDQGVKVDVDVDPRVAPMRVIHADDIEWTEFEDPTGWIGLGAALKRLTNDDCDLVLDLFRFAPNFAAPSHWHGHDTIYIIRRGEFTVEGEGTYVPGDVRWVKGGTAYGSERAGPDGCEVWLVTTGPAAIRNPEVETPPRGYWHDQRG